MLAVRAWENVWKKMSDMATTSVAVPITISGLSMREIASGMKRLRMLNAMKKLESQIQNLCIIRDSVSRTYWKLTHTPNTLV